MASDTATLADACELIVDCPHSTPVWTDSGEVVLRNENIKNGRLDQSSPSFTDADHFADRIRRAAPRPGDLVFTREAPMGEVCMIPNGLRCCLGQRQVLLRPSARFDNHYLLYAIQSPAVQHQIRWNEGTGSTVSNVRIPILKSLRVPAPSKPEQVRTAAVLKALDDRIDHNRVLAANLEAIARTLFKSWFVDFDPVRAKAAGEAPKGLTPDLAALFPGRFVDSKLGLIPEGWTVRSISEICDIIKGRSYKSSELAESATALVTLKSFMRGGGFRADGFKSYTGTYKHEQVIHPGECVIAYTDVTQQADVIGRAALVRESPAHSTLVASLDVAILRPSGPSLSPEFMYLLCQSDDYVQHILTFTTGSTVLHLAKDALPSYKFAHPGEKVIASFRTVTDSLFERVHVLHQEQSALSQLRDLLLPRLISGKLRVEDAEAALEAA